jgi:hypothetical protein
MLAMLLSILIEDPLMATAKARMAAEQPCIQSADETDITVCGMRTADRFRVPLVVHEAQRAYPPAQSHLPTRRSQPIPGWRRHGGRHDDGWRRRRHVVPQARAVRIRACLQ